MKPIVFLLCLLAVFQLQAGPITVKEVEFLVRQQIPENEIVQEVTTRRLLTPLDAQAEKTLKDSGATDALIARLKAAAKALSPAEMQAEAKRQAEYQAHLKNQISADEKRAAEIKASKTMPPGAVAGSVTAVMDALKGRLVKLENDSLVDYDANSLSDTFHYAFYYSASWCGPCQQFTPVLVDGYKKLKANYPKFELIFVSSDKDERAMRDYMIKHKMPWPAVRFKDIDDSVQKWGGRSIPWLVGVNQVGIGTTSNAVLNKFVDPRKILKEIEDWLGGKPAVIHIK